MSIAFGESASGRQVNLEEVFPPGMENYFYTFMDRLSQYVNPDEMAYGGSAAARYRILSAGLELPEQDMRDVSLIVRGRGSVSPRIAETFAIAHHHTGEREEDFYLQVADAYTGLKADLYTAHGDGRETDLARFGNLHVPVSTAADLLADTVMDLQRLELGQLVDPRQLRDARLLIRFVTEAEAETAWQRVLEAPAGRVSLFQAYTHALMLAEGRSELLRANPRRKPAPYACLNCTDTPEFPLTPLAEIQDILGYVE